jgi:uncharacterized protein (DUF4415 family)
MTRLKPGHLSPTPDEDAAITAAALADPDARVLTDEEWDLVKPNARRGEQTRTFTAIHLDAAVVSAFRATGPGWHTRINAALRQFLAEHPFESQ